MNLQQLGADILINEVTNITKLGFWILISGKEYFVPFADYPVFKHANIEQIIEFEMLSPTQIYWKSIDCDVELSALENPKQFPLMYC